MGVMEEPNGQVRVMGNESEQVGVMGNESEQVGDGRWMMGYK